MIKSAMDKCTVVLENGHKYTFLTNNMDWAIQKARELDKEEK